MTPCHKLGSEVNMFLPKVHLLATQALNSTKVKTHKNLGAQEQRKLHHCDLWGIQFFFIL
jgi:hypothetical protein